MTFNPEKEPTFHPEKSESGEEKQEQNLEALENFSLEKGKKIDLALLLLDRKDVAYLGSTKIVENEEEENSFIEEFSKELKEIKKACEELGLLYESEEVKEENAFVSFSIIISKDEEGLNRFSNAEKEKDDKTMGLLLGFPQTSVEAFNSEKSLDFEVFLVNELPEEERKELEEEGVIKFLNFQPSKEHWREELDQARKNQALIKEKTPQLYEEIIEDKDFNY